MISLFRRNKQTLGLDVGSGFVKAAVVDHSGAEPILTHAGYLPLVADAIVEGEIMDPPLVVDTIRALVESLGVTPRSVVTAVGGRDVIIKKIQMDRMPEDDAREVIRWEAEQYVPFDMENVQLDFQILDPGEDGLQMNVLLVAAKRELVEQKVMLLQDAGVAPAVVDVDAFALYNAFEQNYPEAGRGVVGLVNIGHEISTILVMQDGAPVVTRDVPLGSRHLREDLRRIHGLSVDEADAVLQGRTDAQPEHLRVLRERGSELAMSIERAVAFLSMDSALGRGLGALYLCGGGARIPQLSHALADHLHVRLEVLNPLQRLRVHPDALVHFPADELAPMLALPVGLALRGAA
jgi:type IV pilus assembly protein PilM